MKNKVLSKINELNQLAGMSVTLEYSNDYGGFYYLRDGERLAFGVEWLDHRMELKQLDAYLSGVLDWYKFTIANEMEKQLTIKSRSNGVR